MQSHPFCLFVWLQHFLSNNRFSNVKQSAQVFSIFFVENTTTILQSEQQTAATQVHPIHYSNCGSNVRNAHGSQPAEYKNEKRKSSARCTERNTRAKCANKSTKSARCTVRDAPSETRARDAPGENPKSNVKCETHRFQSSASRARGESQK